MKTEKTKTFFEKNWKNILLAVFSLVIVALIMSTTCSNNKLNKAETNIKALTDTIHNYQLKNGELMYEKQGFIADKKELEKYIDISNAEIKELEKKLGSALSTISKLQGQIRIDTIRMTDSVYIDQDSILHNDFRYSDMWLSLDGTTVYNKHIFNTTINNVSMDVPLKVGTTKDDKWFVTSENPYVKISSIEGANIEKTEPKKWAVGIQIGIGPSLGYGILGGSDGIVRSGLYLGFGLNVSLGLTYKIAEF